MVLQEAVVQEVCPDESFDSLKVPFSSRNPFFIQESLCEQGLIETAIEVLLKGPVALNEDSHAQNEYSASAGGGKVGGILEGICMGPGVLVRNPLEKRRYFIQFSSIECIAPVVDVETGNALAQADCGEVKFSMVSLCEESEKISCAPAPCESASAVPQAKKPLGIQLVQQARAMMERLTLPKTAETVSQSMSTAAD